MSDVQKRTRTERGIFLKRGKWWIDYQADGKRRREPVGPYKEQAREALRKVKHDILEGRFPELKRITPRLFDDVVAEYLEKRAGVRKVGEKWEPLPGERGRGRPYPKDWQGVVSNTKILGQHFNGKRLSQINAPAIEDFRVARMAEGVDGATVNRQRACLSAIFKWAIKRRYVGGENPVKDVQQSEESPGRFRFLSAEEADKLIEKASDHLRPILILALHTGGRLSEVLSLKWDDIFLDRGVLYFNQENCKSGKQREIPISPELDTVLREHGKVRDINGYVFTWNGKPIEQLKTSFKNARDRADLGTDVTFHTLRHTFASWYMINGGDIYRLQKYMGHQSIELTQRYSHLSPEFNKAGVQYFGAPRRHQNGTTDGQEKESKSLSA